MSSIRTYSAQELSSSKNAHIVDNLTSLTTLAFLGDPLARYIFNSRSEARFKKSSSRFWNMLIKAAIICDAQAIVMIDDKTQEVQCLGLLLSPGKHPQFEASSTTVRAGGLLVPFTGGFRPALKWAGELNSAMHSMYKRVYGDDEDHWYLFLLATRPDAQNRGFGRRILEEVQRVAIEAADGGVVKEIYLESSSRGNQRLYRRCGWVDRDEYTYGKVEDGQDVATDGQGRSTGGRCFGMVWRPQA